MAFIPPPPPPPPMPEFLALSREKSSEKLTSFDLLGSSQLIDAINNHDIALLKELLETGENINQQTMFGTPLSVAVRNNSIDIVKILVSDSKCDVNCRDYDGEMPLCLALRKCSTPDISLLLLSKGAKVDCLDSVTGFSLLATAIEHQQQEVVDAMIAGSCNVNAKDRNNITPLAHACLLPRPKALSESEDEVTEHLQVKRSLITTLFEAGADVNCCLGPPFNGCLLHMLILQRSTNSISMLLELNKNSQLFNSTVDINIVNSIEKNTPLHYAVATGNAAIVQLLTDHGAKLNEPNVFCDTPLSKALKDRLYDQSAIIKILIAAGADVNFEDSRRSSRRKGPCRPLFAAIENGDRSTVDLLLSYGADLSLCDFEGRCVVMPCLTNGLSIGLLHYIIDKMDELNVGYDISSYDYLEAAFHWSGHLQYLIDKGLDINAVGPKGHHVIHTNLVKWYPASLRILLENGLDPDLLSIAGDTMLSASAGLQSYWPAIQLLVQFGADLNRVFTKGEEEERLTPLQRAFVVEYEEQQCNAPSQFRYFINCGAVLTQHLSLWRDKFVADRIIIETSEDDEVESNSSQSSSGDSPADADAELAAYRNCLLRDLESLFSPLPLSMICRNVIRSCLLTCSPRGQILKSIQSLHLPSSTKSFLSYINVPTGHILR